MEELEFYWRKPGFNFVPWITMALFCVLCCMLLKKLLLALFCDSKWMWCCVNFDLCLTDCGPWLAVLILNLYTVRVLFCNMRLVAFLSFQMEEDKGSVSSAYEFAESKHRGEDSRHLLAEACSQQDSSCTR